MKPVRQSIRHDRNELAYGDCLRACIASLLEIPSDQVPHFQYGMPALSKVIEEASVWLRLRGIDLFSFALGGSLQQALQSIGAGNPRACWILGGNVREGDHGHAVVCRGAEIVHDPGLNADGTKPGACLRDTGPYIALLFGHRALPAASAPVEITPRPAVDFSPVAAHEHIAVSFSGGKDSLAVAYLLRPFWTRCIFYFCQTGDLPPETLSIVAQMQELTIAAGAAWCEITSNSVGWRERFGLPSDIVPVACTPIGLTMGNGVAGRTSIVDRHTCCSQNLWQPVAARLDADNITLVARGTRRADDGWGLLEASHTPTAANTIEHSGRTYWLPIADWSTAHVFEYLLEVGAPIATYYENSPKGPECMTCTAYLDEPRAAFLRQHHPEVAARYAAALKRLKAELRRPLAHLEAEMEALIPDQQSAG